MNADRPPPGTQCSASGCRVRAETYSRNMGGAEWPYCGMHVAALRAIKRRLA